MMNSHQSRSLEEACLSFLHPHPSSKILVVDPTFLSRKKWEMCCRREALHIWNARQKRRFLQDEQSFHGHADYDYIIAGTLLEQIAKPKNAMKQLRLGLKDSGQLISVWRAVDGMEKYIPRLFMAAGFHDLQIQADTPGFWVVAGCQFAKDILLLRQMLDEPTRRHLGRLLRRVENGINSQASCCEICQICDQHSIGMDYLLQFIQHTTLCPQQAKQKFIHTASRLGSKKDEPA